MNLKAFLRQCITLVISVIPPGAYSASEQQMGVNLSYDDSLASQLEYALPALQKHKITASFYLVPTYPGHIPHIEEWRRVAQLGHELGNHSLTHPCRSSKPDREWVSADNDLDLISARQMAEQVIATNQALFALDGRQRRSFTPPCLDILAGGKNYLPLIQNAVSYVKGVGLPEGAETIWAPSDVSGEEMIKFIENQPHHVKIVTLIFHGVGANYLSVSTRAHETLVAYLADHRHKYYIDSYQNVRDWYQRTYGSFESN
ncbi:polysaccharide deacetylase [Alteromonas aestuariivivens]|uniref:Polysaccharide deacetylase n=1 Tax=Alteromonas aestuariivivens TaxID=1938339 RepID=A0A3D8M3F2_9ALTE|nr:polysaccharide deacetylase family protein [Alteromonas aestuariivivens]RDV24267.1 polysaccharide deacetylase [Alteromonas aestuariivivens]